MLEVNQLTYWKLQSESLTVSWCAPQAKRVGLSWFSTASTGHQSDTQYGAVICRWRMLLLFVCRCRRCNRRRQGLWDLNEWPWWRSMSQAAIGNPIPDPKNPKLVDTWIGRSCLSTYFIIFHHTSYLQHLHPLPAFLWPTRSMWTQRRSRSASRLRSSSAVQRPWTSLAWSSVRKPGTDFFSAKTNGLDAGSHKRW